MRKIQVRLPDELIDALTAEAEAEDRALSYVVRRTLEAHVAGTPTPKPRPQRRDRSEIERQVAKVCGHLNVEKRPGASGGLVRSCKDCGKVML